MAAEQNQWPEVVSVALIHHEEIGQRFEARPVGDGYGVWGDDLPSESYVPISRLQALEDERDAIGNELVAAREENDQLHSRLQAEQEKREEVEDQRDAARDASVDRGDRLITVERLAVNRRRRAEKAEAALATERERLEKFTKRCRGEMDAGADAFECGRLVAELEALSPSPAGGVTQRDLDRGEELIAEGKLPNDRPEVEWSHVSHRDGCLPPADPEQQISDTLGEQGESLCARAICEFERRAEDCKEVGSPPEPFIYAAEYLRALLKQFGTGWQDTCLVLSNEGIAGLLKPDSPMDERVRGESMKRRLLAARACFPRHTVELILRPTRPDSDQEADR